MVQIKCSNEECGHTFDYNAKRCPFCGTPVTDACKKVEQPNNESGILVDGKLPFPLEIVGYFSLIYGAFATNGRIKLYQIILISLVEALIGVVLIILGWLLSAGTGLSKAPGLLFMIGIPIVTHAFYSLVKHGSLSYIGKKNMNLSESFTRWILFLIEFIIGIVFLAISIWIDNTDPTPGDNNWTPIFSILGIGMLIGGIWSIIKYFRRRKK